MKKLIPSFRHVVYFMNFNMAARFLRFLQLQHFDADLHVFTFSPFYVVSFLPVTLSQCELIQYALDSHKRFIHSIDVKPIASALPNDFK